MLEEPAGLGQNADQPSAQPGLDVGGLVAEPSSVNGDGPAVRVVEPGEQVQQRRLARARGPDDRDQLPRGERDRDVPERGDLLADASVGACDACELSTTTPFSLSVKRTRLPLPVLAQPSGCVNEYPPGGLA